MTDLTTPESPRFGHQAPEIDLDLFAQAAAEQPQQRTTPWSNAPALPADEDVYAAAYDTDSTASTNTVDDHDPFDDEPNEPATAGTRKPRNRDRANLRRGIAKYDQLLTARPELRAALAAVLRVQDSARDLTFAIMAGQRTAARAIDDVRELSSLAETPVDALIAAVSLPRHRMKAVWALLTALDHARGPLPQADVKAGALLMKHATQLTDTDLEELAAVHELARR
ncbi:hypothetical protein [Agromyces humi]|uniref:hypothetical protein n=1 Tax=Agromyces humi TaxID=1766800 RepID=UPI00135C3306|nr:hypothetical protein [Agromyces humi]